MFDAFSSIGGFVLLAAVPSIHFMEWRSVGVFYLTAMMALFCPPALLESHPAIVHTLASHPAMIGQAWEPPRPFYWLGADSAGNPVIMKLGKPGEPSVPYDALEAGASPESITPYHSERDLQIECGEDAKHFQPGIVDELTLCREVYFSSECNSYFYTHEGGKIVPVNMMWERIVGAGMRIVLEQVFGLLGALLGFWGSVLLQRVGLRFDRRGGDSG